MRSRIARGSAAFGLATALWVSGSFVGAQTAPLFPSPARGPVLILNWPSGYYQDVNWASDQILQGVLRVYAQWQAESAPVLQFEPYVFMPSAPMASHHRGDVTRFWLLSRPRTGQFTAGALTLRPRCIFDPASWRGRFIEAGGDRPSRTIVVSHFLPVWWIRLGTGYSGEVTVNLEPAQRYFVNYQVDADGIAANPSSESRIVVQTRQRAEAVDVFRDTLQEPLNVCAPDEGTSQLNLEKLRAGLRIEFQH